MMELRAAFCCYNYEKSKKMATARSWRPCEDLTGDVVGLRYALLILNTPIDFSFNPTFVVNLWNNAKVRITVDGGTCRWLNWLEANEREFRSVLAPDLITGDMDSLPPEVIQKFAERDTKVIRTEDQDETDFTKSLRQLRVHCEENDIQIDTVFVLADTCGRFDQIMANVNTLFKAKSILEANVFQIASNSVTWLLEKGAHSISIPRQLRERQEWCALVPVGAPCVVTTTGLKWNLENGKLEFGGMVSSSNTYDGSPNVTVEADTPVIWSMSIDSLL